MELIALAHHIMGIATIMEVAVLAQLTLGLATSRERATLPQLIMGIVIWVHFLVHHPHTSYHHHLAPLYLGMDIFFLIIRMKL